MKIALCTCRGKVKRKTLEKIPDADVFDDLCSQRAEKRYDIVGCDHPSLKEVGKILINLNELVFLRQKDSLRKAKLIIDAYKELLRLDYEFLKAEIDPSLLIQTDNFELAKSLSKHFQPLFVVTRNRKIMGTGRTIIGEVKSVSGNIGDFRVKIHGFDAHTGERVDEIKVSQVLIPGFPFKKDGLFNDEIDAIEAIYNKEGAVKVKSLDYRRDFCCVSLNGVSGCKLCTCIHNCIEHGESLIIDQFGCMTCGKCSSQCPTDALRFMPVPREVILRQANIFREYKGKKVLLFACINALHEVYGESRVETLFPILLPCVNVLSEVEVLYPLLSGFSGVYVLRCECQHGNAESIENAIKIARAFGISSLIMESNFSEKKLESLIKKEPIANDFELNAEKKREQLIEIIGEIKRRKEMKEKVIDIRGFGQLRVNESCTLCNTCNYSCITNAIRREGNYLKFTHGLCIDCGLCEKLCPEKAIFIEKGLSLEDVENEVILKSDEMIACPKCGKEHMSKTEYKKISERIGYEVIPKYCPDCRATIIFEEIYKEIMEGRGGE